jgi:hypothetical protein
LLSWYGMAEVHPRGAGGNEPPARAFSADTLRWVAGGELQWCACEECWAQQPFWRYLDMLTGEWRAENPRGSRAALAHFVWDALSASSSRRALWRLSRPRRARAVAALRAEGASGGWNLGELYEIAMRGLVLRTPEEP